MWTSHAAADRVELALRFRRRQRREIRRGAYAIENVLALAGSAGGRAAIESAAPPLAVGEDDFLEDEIELTGGGVRSRAS